MHCAARLILFIGSDEMEMETLFIRGIPAVVWGELSHHVLIAVHGNLSHKTDTVIRLLAEAAIPKGLQVLSLDLPEHGDRPKGNPPCKASAAKADLGLVMEYAKSRWREISLFACSMGAYFSLLAYPDETIRQCLFLSPVVDMRRLIENMLRWSNLSQQRLAAEGELVTVAGQTLYWDDYCFIKAHPVTRWEPQTEILYGENDGLCERAVLDAFVQRFDCRLQVVKQGEHWFHTPEQLAVYRNWLEKRIEPASSEYDLKGESEC